MPGGPPRRGARSRAAIPAAHLAALHDGEVAAATLAECLAVDHARLVRRVVPALAPAALAAVEAAAGAGITRRMALVADLLLAHGGVDVVATLAVHPSDTVRGWGAFVLGRAPSLDVAERLARLRPFADDPHFGVREWAWLALRPTVVAEPAHVIEVLEPWVQAPSPFVRRFAVEATRPRGVWSAHVPALVHDPVPGLALLAPVRRDPARYVQDSVANWLNDAAKSRPDWVRAVCAAWRSDAPTAATARICTRALRTIGASAD
jgi:3-methyladenine DNA glycosylase AlkC